MSREDTLDRIPRGTRVRVIEVCTGPAGFAAPENSDATSADASRHSPSSVLGSDSIADTKSRTDAIVRRLDDLGIRNGVEIEVIRRAPLGDPTVYELHGYQLCLRRSESSRVRVEASDAGEPRP